MALFSQSTRQGVSWKVPSFVRFRVSGALPLCGSSCRTAESRSDVWRIVIVVGTAAQHPKFSVWQQMRHTSHHKGNALQTDLTQQQTLPLHASPSGCRGILESPPAPHSVLPISAKLKLAARRAAKQRSSKDVFVAGKPSSSL